MANVNNVFDSIPVLFTEDLDSFQPVSNEFFNDFFHCAVDEAYTALSLKNGGFILSDRTGSGSSFAIKNVVSELQKRRMTNNLPPFNFITIDNKVFDTCYANKIVLGDYIEEIINQVDKNNPDNFVFISDSYVIGDKLAQLSPNLGFKTILEIAEADFKNIFNNKKTNNIAKRMASGWVVGKSPFNYLEMEQLTVLVAEMVNYGLQGSNYNVNAQEVSRLIDIMSELIVENEEFSLIWESLAGPATPETKGIKMVPLGFLSQFIQLFTLLKNTSVSKEYSIERFNDEYEQDKEIIRQVIYFSSTWNIALENNQSNEPEITIVPAFGGEALNMGELTSEDFDKIVEDFVAQVSGGKPKEEKEEEEKQNLEFNDLDTVAQKIKKEVLCQDDVIDSIVGSFSVPATGLRDESKPIRSIIAAGSTGVGKALHAKTPILTPYGYKTVEELNPGDTIFSGEGNPCNITAKYQPMTKDHYILSFSNGESIIACGDHLWNIVTQDGTKHTVDTRTLSARVHTNKELAYIVSPEIIEDNVQREEKIEFIRSQDNKVKELIDNVGFTAAVKVIVQRYCEVVVGNSGGNVNYEKVVNNDSAKGSERGLESTLARQIVGDGNLPTWFPIMPLEERLQAVSKIIDLLDDVNVEQSKKCTYVRFRINDNFHSDLVKLFSTVGCVRYIDRVNSIDKDGKELLNFSVGENIAEISSKLCADEIKKDRFNVSRCIEIFDVEHIDESIVDPADFYCFTVDSENALFLCGESNIPTHNTKLAYSLSENLYTEPVELVRLDMSEYHDKHEAARLVGSPPGYQGFKEGGVLSNVSKKHPNAIILIDELEKAHPDIWNIFLQVLDAGRLTDGTGETVDFTNNIFIFTTNLGVEERKKSGLGFAEKISESENRKESTYQAIRKHLKPELINRIDEIVVFNDIGEGANLIVKKEIHLLRDKMKKQGYTIRRIPENIVTHVLSKSNFKTYGARDIQRIVRKEISEKVAKEILRTKKNDRKISEKEKEKDSLKNVSLSLKNGIVIAKTKEQQK